jgi:potassium-transporting ATPase KdpC subunit
MLTETRRALVFVTVMMLTTGVGYPLVVWVAGRAAFPAQAEGTLVKRADGTVIGSRLIGQRFTLPEYFSPRPSAVDFDAAASGSSNLGPTNPAQVKGVAARLEAVARRDGVAADRVPSDLVTASGSGLDPDISPESAAVQVTRVARARGVEPSRVRDLVVRHTEGPAWGFVGMPRVNVFELNRALDAAFGHGK